MAVFQLDNVIAINRNEEPFMFIANISAHSLAELSENGIIEYNPNIQRGIRTLKSGKVKPIFSVKHAKEIFNAMLSGDIFGGIITLRHDENDKSELTYDEDNKVLIISDESKKQFDTPIFQVVDGQHRLESSKMWKKAWEKNPENFNDPNTFDYPVAILSLDEDDAKKLFSEYSMKPLPISKIRQKFLDVGNLSNFIARETVNKSELKGKIELTSTSIKGKNAIITFGNLYDSIKNNFNPSSKKEAEKIVNFLIEYFNELVDIFPKQLGNIDNDFKIATHNRNEERKNTFILESLAWNGIVAVASKLYEEKKWKDKLQKLNEEVEVGEWKGRFLDKSNPLFSPVFTEKGKIINNSATQTHMTKIITNFVLTGTLGYEELAS